MMPALEGDGYERSDAELLGAVAAGDLAAMHPQMRKDLTDLGLI